MNPPRLSALLPFSRYEVTPLAVCSAELALNLRHHILYARHVGIDLEGPLKPLQSIPRLTTAEKDDPDVAMRGGVPRVRLYRLLELLELTPP